MEDFKAIYKTTDTAHVKTIELLRELNYSLGGELFAIEIPERMFWSLWRRIEEMHLTGESVIAERLQVFNGSIVLDAMTIVPEINRAIGFKGYDDSVMFELSPTKGEITIRYSSDPFSCLHELMVHFHYITGQVPSQIRMSIGAVAELHKSAEASRHIGLHDGFRQLVVNGVKIELIESGINMLARARCSWNRSGEVIKPVEVNVSNPFDLEREMDLMIQNMRC